MRAVHVAVAAAILVLAVIVFLFARALAIIPDVSEPSPITPKQIEACAFPGGTVDVASFRAGDRLLLVLRDRKSGHVATILVPVPARRTSASSSSDPTVPATPEPMVSTAPLTSPTSSP